MILKREWRDDGILCVVFTDKDRELGDALAEIKSLKNSERSKEKAVEEVIYIDIQAPQSFLLFRSAIEVCIAHCIANCIDFESINMGEFLHCL
jgi:hypothetical protein